MSSDSESDFELFSSQPEKASYETAPSDKVFKIKLLFIDPSAKAKKLSYQLKAGSPLPYTAKNIAGIH